MPACSNMKAAADSASRAQPSSRSSAEASSRPARPASSSAEVIALRMRGGKRSHMVNILVATAPAVLRAALLVARDLHLRAEDQPVAVGIEQVEVAHAVRVRLWWLEDAGAARAEL